MNISDPFTIRFNDSFFVHVCFHVFVPLLVCLSVRMIENIWLARCQIIDVNPLKIQMKTEL